MNSFRRNSDSDQSDEGSSNSQEKPRIINTMVEFSLGPVNPHVTCRLCEGYFRDPITITECLHTFCKSCLYYAFSAGFRKCPTCDIGLGGDPFRVTLPDRILEQLVDKVLFKETYKKDRELEHAFYAEKGIKMKPEFYEKEQQQLKEEEQRKMKTVINDGNSSDDDNMSENQDELIDFMIKPYVGDDEEDGSEEDEEPLRMPPIENDILTTSSKMKIFNLKRFVLSQLKLECSSEVAGIDILCNDIILGNELSLDFIDRTIWMDYNEMMVLTYRYADDSMI
mmetsp:Transcript_4620/g.6671  ORF Transcript_4620/g.6671 Transcript_4620/m.6671 type:complete len:281 (-) Transcript_4620:2228-3070(-)